MGRLKAVMMPGAAIQKKAWEEGGIEADGRADGGEFQGLESDLAGAEHRRRAAGLDCGTRRRSWGER